MLSGLNMFISFEALFGTQLVGHKRLWTALVKNNTTHNYVCIFVLSQSVLECDYICMCVLMLIQLYGANKVNVNAKLLAMTCSWLF